MAGHKFRLVLAAVLGLAFSCVTPAAQGNHWQELMQAAEKSTQQKNYKAAEKQYKEALREAEAFGKQDPRLATTLRDLAALYESQSKFDKAETLYQRALAISESLLSPNDPKLIESVSKLADIEWLFGRLDKAELLCQRAVEMTERVHGPDHLELAKMLDRLAIYEYIDGLYAAGYFDPRIGMELAFAPGIGPIGTIQSVSSFDELRGPLLSRTAIPSSALDSFSQLKSMQIKKLSQSAAHFERALAIREKALGKEDLQVANTLTILGFVCFPLRRLDETESHFKRALAIREKAIGPQSSAVAVTLSYLARSYAAQGKLTSAELYHRRAVGTQQMAVGLEDPRLIPILRPYAALLRRLKRESAAKEVEAKIEDIQKQQAAKTPPR
jgi:tetratricopeptide (TPR) repeat protein